MNELNPILDALNDIDTRYIIEPKRRKRPIALIIAAAAAALMLMTGFTVVVASGSPGVNVRHIRRTDHGPDLRYDHQFSYNITDKKDLNILTKDELLELGAVELGDLEKGFYVFDFDNVLPSDILKLYNAEPITFGNDNFTEKPDFFSIDASSLDKDDQYDYVNFSYSITHKKSGTVLGIGCYFSINGFDLTSTYESDETFDKEIISLNDGSMCLLLEQHMEDGYSYSTAAFSYNGVIYSIGSMDHMNKEQMKEALSDLGVL